MISLIFRTLSGFRAYFLKSLRNFVVYLIVLISQDRGDKSFVRVRVYGSGIGARACRFASFESRLVIGAIAPTIEQRFQIVAQTPMLGFCLCPDLREEVGIDANRGGGFQGGRWS